MKLKQMLLWEWKANRTAFLVFYLIILIATTVGTIIVASLGQVDTASSSALAVGGMGISPAGIESFTATFPSSEVIITREYLNFNMISMIPGTIFLFIVGLASFGENIRVALSNGVSRRTHFLSFLVFTLIVSAFASGYSLLVDSIPRLSPQTFSAPFTESPGELFLYFLSISLFVLALGYFIAGSYYRMNTSAKVAVSVGVPAGLIILTAYIDSRFKLVENMTPPQNDQLVAHLTAFGNWLENFMNASLFLICCAVLLLLLGWLLTRRAPIKPPIE